MVSLSNKYFTFLLTTLWIKKSSRKLKFSLAYEQFYVQHSESLWQAEHEMVGW